MVRRATFSLLLAVVLVAGSLLTGVGQWLTPKVSAADPIGLTTAYPSVVTKAGDLVIFGITLNNPGKTGQQVDLALDQVPDNWSPVLKAMGMTVRRVYVEPEKTTTVDLQLKPPVDAKIQDYDFSLKARAVDGSFETRLKLAVGVQEKGAGGTKLTTLYQDLRGPAGNRFNFKVDLINENVEDRTYSVSAAAPQGWEVSLKPAYESTQVNSLRLKAGDTKGLDIDLTPPDRVEAGDYEITVQALAGNDKATITLKVKITGTYKLGLRTQNDLLNTQATAGQDTTVSLEVSNTGSADLNNVALSSSKPDSWTVTFVPDKLDTLERGATREVQAVIKPAGKAIPGDYALTVMASNPQTSGSVALRVTVETPTVWGWVGVAIVFVVVVGLFGVFRTLSRR